MGFRKRQALKCFKKFLICLAIKDVQEEFIKYDLYIGSRLIKNRPFEMHQPRIFVVWMSKTTKQDPFQ